MRDYRLISGDSHINEPPDLWASGLPARFKSRAPRIDHFPQGDAWVFEGIPDPINFGNNINGTWPVEKRTPWVRWEDVPPGGYVPSARLLEQDKDGVGAEILYPTPRPSTAVFANRSDPEFHLALIRAYNDWLSGYCSYSPDRLVGVAAMPTVGVDAAIAELKRTMKLPGMRSILLGCYPNGTLTLTPDDDRFWAAAHEMGVAINVHVGMVTSPPAADRDPNRTRTGAFGELRHLDAPVRCFELIHSGIFDRFPNLNVVFAEVDCGWIPYVKEQFDDRFKRKPPAARPKLKQLPSDYFNQNLFFTYITDHYGVVNRYFIGVSQMLWSSDYPHGGTDWPNSWKIIERDFAGVPEDEKHAILAGNAARVYKLADGRPVYLSVTRS